MDFQRARNDEQRGERRRAILETTAAMLLEMPVAQLSLNELSRRVNLAKSNVLRYFESREAILLDLLSAELEDWITQLDAELTPSSDPLEQRIDALGEVIASTLIPRHVLCDLMSAQTAVLERNVSAAIALRHKRAIGASVDQLTTALQRRIPELTADTAYELVAMTFITAGAVWPQTHPSEALQEVYRDNPDIATVQMDFAEAVNRFVATFLRGILARP
jgi:AcrR family transcriptional regulator